MIPGRVSLRNFLKDTHYWVSVWVWVWLWDQGCVQRLPSFVGRGRVLLVSTIFVRKVRCKRIRNGSRVGE